MCARLAVASLERARTAKVFESVYCSAERKCSEFDFEPPCLPRKRIVPRRLDEGGSPHIYDTPRDYYRQIYYSCLDSIVVTVNERFDQPCLKIYKSVEETVWSSQW